MPDQSDKAIMKIIILFTLTLFTSSLMARSPAVDPVKGISIEEYQEVDPATTRGFDFSKAETNYEKAPGDTQLTLTTALFLVIASAMPIVVWFGVMRALPDATPTEQSSTRPTFSVINGEGKQEDDDNDSLPKAS